jgi:drug/metabolite transporter (DMT)-like permease
MTAIAILLGFISQLFTVAGQLLFKHAMNPAPRPRKKTATLMTLGIAIQALWFFLWLGLLQKWDLSRLYAFEGLAPALMAMAAWLFLKEHLTPMAWAGLAIICLGIGIASCN